MTDPRPRPQYGEYATEEEQRAAIKDPESNPHYAPPEPALDGPSGRGEDVDGAPFSGRTGAHESGGRGAGVSGESSGDEPQVSASPALRHPADRMISIALLVFGLYNVITTIMDRDDIATAIDQAYRSMGLSGDYTATALTGTVADITSIVSLALWVAAAGLTVWAIARGRLAFWIPLAAGLLAAIVSGVGYLVLFLHDPTFLAYLQQAG